MIKILLQAPNVLDATAFYRADPIVRLRKVAPELNIDVTYCFQIDQTLYSILPSVDVLFLQRPYTETHLALLRAAKTNGIKTWIDYDDLLIDVPTDNTQYPLYSQRSVKSNIIQLITEADLVTVSTTLLKEIYNNLNSKIHVVPNALNDYCFRKTPAPEFKKTVVWRGTNTHQKDLMTYADQIIEVANKFPDVEFLFMNYNPWFITEKLKNSRFAPGMDIHTYMEYFRETSPLLTIVPLSQSNFNMAKSNCCWLEATYAGSPVLAPKWPEWEQPGVFNYSSTEEFGDNLDLILSWTGNAMLTKGQQLSWDRVQRDYLLSKVNYKRVECLGRLLDL